MTPDRPPAQTPTPEEQKRRRARSVAIALALGALAVLFYVVTMAKLGPQILQRPM
jgi:hypothetical protein